MSRRDSPCPSAPDRSAPASAARRNRLAPALVAVPPAAPANLPPKAPFATGAAAAAAAAVISASAGAVAGRRGLGRTWTRSICELPLLPSP